MVEINESGAEIRNCLRNWPKKYWPKEILHIPQPPKKLRIRGEYPNLDFHRLCIVGPRKHTEYGETVCRNLIAGLAGYPISIVSGLAYGIDSIAHSAALENKIHTIALPGSGLSPDAIYPAAHFRLSEDIIESGGCLISEYPDDFRSTNWAFPQRNRLMVGISDATLIIEAEEKSGTMITARMTTDYNHDLLAVPGSVLSSSSVGVNKLIKDGACVIQTSEDILNFFGFDLKEKDPTTGLSVDEKNIYEQLDGVTSAEDLIRKNNLSVSAINSIITALEIKDLIQIVDGKICRK